MSCKDHHLEVLQKQSADWLVHLAFRVTTSAYPRAAQLTSESLERRKMNIPRWQRRTWTLKIVSLMVSTFYNAGKTVFIVIKNRTDHQAYSVAGHNDHTLSIMRILCWFPLHKNPDNNWYNCLKSGTIQHCLNIYSWGQLKRSQPISSQLRKTVRVSFQQSCNTTLYLVLVKQTLLMLCTYKLPDVVIRQQQEVKRPWPWQVNIQHHWINHIGGCIYTFDVYKPLRMNLTL